VTSTPPRRTPRSPHQAALRVATDAYGLPITEPDFDAGQAHAETVARVEAAPADRSLRYRPAPEAEAPTTPAGQPPRATTISVRLSGELLERFERWAIDHRWSRGRAATVAIERVLDGDRS